MPDKMSIHLERAQATQAAIAQLPAIPDLPAAAVTGHKAMIDALIATEASVGEAEAALLVKTAEVNRTWREVWRQCSTWYAVAKVTASAAARAALKQIHASHGFTPLYARQRAEQTLAALSQFPDGFNAAGLTKNALAAAIQAQLVVDAEQQDLEAALHALRSDLKTADTALDKENKRIYAIINANFAKDSRERDIIRGIPTRVPRSSPATPPPLPAPAS